MTKLLVKNTKILKSNSDKVAVYNFGIPAFRSKSGFKTCPLAGKCASGCYARQSAYIFTTVKAAYEWRLKMSLKSDFANAVALELEPKVRTATRLGKTLVIRIHDSGDFYSLEYINKWFKVMTQFPDVKFYSYTKMVPIFKQLKDIPINFTLIYSEGGLADKRIDYKKDRHSRVFESLEQLKAAGYTDCTENDLNVYKSLKCGLVYHGHNKYRWKTSA